MLVSCKKEDCVDETPLKKSSVSFTKSSQSNDIYYSQISTYGREYLADDFPNDFGEYYKVIKTYEELKNSISNVDSIDKSIFEYNYVVVLRQHYENAYFFPIGFKNAHLFENSYIILDYYFDDTLHYPDQLVSYDKFSYLIVPKKVVSPFASSEIKPLCVTFDKREFYDFKKISLTKTSNKGLENGKSWIIQNKNDADNFNAENGTDIDIKIKEEHFVLALYFETSISEIVGFKDYFSNEKNVYITFEKIGRNVTELETGVIYLIDIPTKSIDGKYPQNYEVNLLELTTQSFKIE